MLLLFSIISLSSATLPELYSVFNLPLKKVPSWLKRDKKSAVKDLFIAYQHLPRRYRKFSHTVPLQPEFSIDKKSEFRFIVISTKKRMTTSFLLGGVKQGTISINGAVRKRVKTKSPIDPVVFTTTFEPGNYLFVLTVEKRFLASIAPLLLATRKIPQSKTKSFTKKSLATVRFSSIKPPPFHLFFSDWYARHCFPEKRNNSATVEKSHSLRTLLFKASHTSEELKLLQGVGFDAALLKWWRDEFSQKGVCNVEEY
ncbi:hypothetical protein KAH37_05110 [bacterium]|nr:hypothetical protein [bacterium]